ncbi:MAG: hypothetical protein HF314_06355 [Ignavibacteria bacterium]|nr:hypothetical protein [Ignavibacteria bacterium]MCU7502676.1 hypothetical protein [Ignavibacteria bacterium]MCU7515121.1 hypothetical protein [Ignavibacteria bacterium]
MRRAAANSQLSSRSSSILNGKFCRP